MVRCPVIRTIRLRFTVGEVQLWNSWFRAEVLQPDLADLLYAPEKVAPPATLPTGVDAIVIRSQPCPESISRLSRTAGVLRYAPSTYRHYYIDLKGTFTDYLKTFSGKSRSTLQRKVRKFAEFSGGAIQWRAYRRPEDILDFYRLAREVSAKSYQEQLLHSGMPDTEAYRDELCRKAANDEVRGYILFHEQRPIAYMVCPEFNGALFYDHLGYVPEFREWSPGTILQYLALESIFNDGRFSFFDFGEGEAAHKEFFSTGHLLCADVYYFRLTLRNLLRVSLHVALLTATETTGKILQMLRIKARIKRLIRQKATA